MALDAKNKPKYRMVYTQGSAAPVLEPVLSPEEEKRKQQMDRARRERMHAKRNIAHRNQQKALSFNKSYVIFLTAVTFVIVIACSIFLTQRAKVTANMKEITSIQTQISDAKAANDALEKSISTSVSLNDIKEKADEIGLSYPKKNQVLYYSVQNDDYMTQLEND